VETVLGLLGFCLFILAVISLAASISWAVVKLTPKPRQKPKTELPAGE
jgi:hypothetical protein